jgi:hypothetical protein
MGPHRKPVPVLLHTAPRMSFSLVDPALYLFTVTHFRCEYNYMVNACSTAPNLWVLTGPLKGEGSQRYVWNFNYINVNI